MYSLNIRNIRASVVGSTFREISLEKFFYFENSIMCIISRHRRKLSVQFTSCVYWAGIFHKAALHSILRYISRNSLLTGVLTLQSTNCNAINNELICKFKSVLKIREKFQELTVSKPAGFLKLWKICDITSAVEFVFIEAGR